MEDRFERWIGHAVVLQMALGEIRVPLCVELLKNEAETLRVRIGGGWDVDIYKDMVLAVEGDSMMQVPAS
jgi:hypothetical protein